MTSILFVIPRIHGKKFKSNFLRKSLSLNFLLYFWNLPQSLNILIQKITLIAYVFRKLGTGKGVVRKMCKKPQFRTLFNRERAKGYQTLLNSAGQHLYHFLPSSWWKCCWSIPLLLIFEILGLFASTLTADDKYSLGNSDNLRQPFWKFWNKRSAS